MPNLSVLQMYHLGKDWGLPQMFYFGLGFGLY